MSFADEWDMFPECGVETSAPAKKINTADFDAEFEAFCVEQRKIKAERQVKEVENLAKEVEAQPTDEVVEEAYQAFVEEDEKPKSKKKKKTEAVVEETPEVTKEVAEN